MDIKELLSLAKDNQSFAMKKFQRDNMNKSKSGKSEVSDSAVKAFVAKKKQMEEQRKASEAAERRRRIQARLEASQGKKESSNEIKNIEAKTELKKPIDVPKASNQGKDEEMKQRFQIPKKKEINGVNVKSAVKPAVLDSSRTNSHGQTTSNEFKQHRRRKGKECDFEWSGSASTGQRSSSNTFKTSNPVVKKPVAGPSFKEIMNIAEKQKDKAVPTIPKKIIDERLKSASKTGPMDTALKNSPKSNNKERNEDCRSKSRALETCRAKSNGQSSPHQVSNQSSKHSKCTVTTHTVDIRNNYAVNNNFRSNIYKDVDYPMDINRVNSKLNGHNRGRPSIGSKRSNMSSLDDELERERIQLERKRELLRRKMQGANYDYDDAYGDADDNGDDLDDFIDDEGDEVDYSRHIRNIFGYDRRKFIDDEDDLRDMESNYRQISAEEARSARIGRLEDEIERQKEEMEERKAKRMKK